MTIETPRGVVDAGVSREKYLERQRRYNHSEKGRERYRKFAAQPHVKAEKALYELYRIKIPGLY